MAAREWPWKKQAWSDRRLTDSAKLLATCLCDDFAHHDTGFCGPSVQTLADALGVSVRTIQRALAHLVAAGWITIREGRGRGRHSEILFGKGADLAAFGRPEKVTAVTQASPEKVTAVTVKGDSRDAPYSKDEPKKNQRAREPGPAPDDRPSRQCAKAAHPGSAREEVWDCWLKARGHPTLRMISLRSGGVDGVGWDIPFAMPPNAEDCTELAITQRWLNWSMGQMQLRERRYA